MDDGKPPLMPLDDVLDGAARRFITQVRAGTAPKDKKPAYKGRKAAPKRRPKHVDPR